LVLDSKLSDSIIMRFHPEEAHQNNGDDPLCNRAQNREDLRGEVNGGA
jgi:hypothetical protein